MDDDEDNGCHVWMTMTSMGATPRDLHERVRVRVDNVMMMLVEGCLAVSSYGTATIPDSANVNANGAIGTSMSTEGGK